MKVFLLTTSCFLGLLLLSNPTPVLSNPTPPVKGHGCEPGEGYMEKKADVEIEACVWGVDYGLTADLGQGDPSCSTTDPGSDKQFKCTSSACSTAASDPSKYVCNSGVRECPKKKVELPYKQCDASKSTEAFTTYRAALAAAAPVPGKEYQKFPVMKQFELTMKWQLDDRQGWTEDNFAGKVDWRMPLDLQNGELSLSANIQNGINEAFCVFQNQMSPDNAPYADKVGEKSGSPLCPWEIHVVTTDWQHKESMCKDRQGTSKIFTSTTDKEDCLVGQGYSDTYEPIRASGVKDEGSGRDHGSNNCLGCKKDSFLDIGHHQYTPPAMQMLDVKFIGDPEKVTYERSEGTIQTVKVTFVVFLKNQYQVVAMDQLFEALQSSTDTKTAFLDNYLLWYINLDLQYPKWKLSNPYDPNMHTSFTSYAGHGGNSARESVPELKSIVDITALTVRSGSECPQDRKKRGFILIDQTQYNPTGSMDRSDKVDKVELVSYVKKSMEICQHPDEMLKQQIQDKKFAAGESLFGGSESVTGNFPMYGRFALKFNITLPPLPATSSQQMALLSTLFENVAFKNALKNALLFSWQEVDKYGSDGDGHFMNGELGAMTAADIGFEKGDSVTGKYWQVLPKDTPTITYKRTNHNIDEFECWWFFQMKDLNTYRAVYNWHESGLSTYLLNVRMVEELNGPNSPLVGTELNGWAYPKISYDENYLNGDALRKGMGGIGITAGVITDSFLAKLGFTTAGDGTSGTTSTSGTSSVSGASSCTTLMMGMAVVVMAVITML